MRPARILILTNSPLCRNPRVVKEATTLGQAGHDVTVLGIRNHLPSVALDQVLVAGAPFRHVQVDMLGHDASARARITVWLRRIQHRLAREACPRLGWQLASALGPASALLAAARRHPADLFIVHNEVAHWVGTQLIAEGRRVCADIEDWHSEDLLPDQRYGRPLNLLRTVERKLLHHAIHTTTTSHALADALHARYGGRRPHVITNSFPLQPAPNRDACGEPPAFFWFSQTIGAGRGLELFLAAWKQTTHPSRLVLLGESRAAFAQKLLARLPDHFRTRVSFRPLVPPHELPNVIAAHDIGLALEQAFIPNRDLTITNKIIQYLNAGLAIVASDTAGQREVLAHAPAAGIIVQTHETTRFAHELDNLLADRAALTRCRIAARLLAETTYCWEREEPRLVQLVQNALSTPL